MLPSCCDATLPLSRAIRNRAATRPSARVPPCLCSTMMNIVCTQCHMYRELYLQRASHLAFWFDHSSPQCVVMVFFVFTTTPLSIWVTFFGLVVV